MLINAEYFLLFFYSAAKLLLQELKKELTASETNLDNIRYLDNLTYVNSKLSVSKRKNVKMLVY